MGELQRGICRANLGLALLKGGKPAEAIPVLQEAARIGPHVSPMTCIINLHMCLALAELNRWDEASEQFHGAGSLWDAGGCRTAERRAQGRARAMPAEAGRPFSWWNEYGTQRWKLKNSFTGDSDVLAALHRAGSRRAHSPPLTPCAGLTILLMVFVNDLGRAAPSWMHHIQPPDADGMTLADVVFPWFLFIVGVSIPLAVAGRVARRSSIGGSSSTSYCALRACW